MSIDARVDWVGFKEDGSGVLYLEDRPAARPDENPGIAGQRMLHFDKAPHDVTALTGKDIWGGSSEIMYGTAKIAVREGYTKIRFVVDSIVFATHKAA
jgi:hypothetical protein